MKVLFLCHGAGNGGAERVITTLASEFADRHYQVELITTNKANNDYKISPRVVHKVVLSEKRNVIIRSIERIIILRRVASQFDPDCIISFSSIPNIQIIAATIGKKYKLIISERTDPSRYPVSKLAKFFRNLLYPLADCIVFQTNEAREYFPDRIKNISVLIPNPIRKDLPDTYKGKREKRIVGVGSLSDQKNWEMALCACKKFFKIEPEYIFEIYGEGPERQRLQKIINSDLYLKNRVTLKGFSDNVVYEILNAKMYISSSNYEGISNAMLEALAIGVPTICTDCPVGGAREYIQNESNGLLVPVGDADELYKAMIKLATNDEFCNVLSRKSIKIKQRLDMDFVVDMWEKEVLELCSNK